MAKFAELEDVTSRFEGEFPSEREDWAETRLSDAENALMGLVPSLRKTVQSIAAESAVVGDPDRLDRVRTLVCDKVLQLYRNPDRANLKTRSIDDVSETRAWYTNPPGGSITFTEGELASVRLRKTRSRVGTIRVAPWRPHTGVNPWRTC